MVITVPVIHLVLIAGPLTLNQCFGPWLAHWPDSSDCQSSQVAPWRPAQVARLRSTSNICLATPTTATWAVSSGLDVQAFAIHSATYRNHLRLPERNCLSRSLRGALNTSSGGPSSSVRP